MKISPRKKTSLSEFIPVKSSKTGICPRKYLTGFTLIEILVVIAIIGVLATMIVANYAHAQAIARDSRRRSDVALIYAAAKIYYDQKGTFLVPYRQVNADGTTTDVPSGCGNHYDGGFNTEDTGTPWNNGPDHPPGCDFSGVNYPHSIENAFISQGLLSKSIKDPLEGKPGYTYMYYPSVTDTNVFAHLENPSAADLSTCLTGDVVGPCGQDVTNPDGSVTVHYGMSYKFSKNSL